MKFEELSLAPGVMKGIQKVGFRECTQVQEKTLPLSLAGRDVACQAQTGTGKTAAFLITIFNRMLKLPAPPKRRTPSPRAYIIAPTRELALQIHKDALDLGSAVPFRMAAIYGGLGYEQQKEQIKSAPDILIGTPGRLIDFFKQKLYDFKRLQMLVIDEADRMFDMGFIADLRFMLRRMPPYHSRQSMLFSATLSYRVMELAYEHMNDPDRVEISPDQVAAKGIKHELYHIERARKFSLLLGILKNQPWERVLIFVNTRRQGDILEERLRKHEYNARAITGDLPQQKRLRILESFRSKKLPILVATDVASRGLHIEAVSHVINYDLPQDCKDYVHRAGRTARAGATGMAISLACEEYVHSLEEIEEYMQQKIPVVWPEDDLFIKPLPFKRSAPRKAPDRGRPRPTRTRR